MWKKNIVLNYYNRLRCEKDYLCHVNDYFNKSYRIFLRMKTV